MKNIDRFWQKIEKTESCWNWTATKSRGYGSFFLINKMIPAHRFSWEIHNGKIPNKMLVLHKCDNRACVNPNHLFLGTYKDNTKDMFDKGRQGDHSGENQGLSKLKNKDVIEIRNEYKLGNTTYRKLADKYNVYQSTIYHVLKNKTWKHIK